MISLVEVDYFVATVGEPSYGWSLTSIGIKTRLYTIKNQGVYTMVTKQLPPTALGPEDPDDGDTGRQLRGMAIAARVQIKQSKLGYKVPSQSENGAYIVNVDGDPYCSCPDFEKRDQPCKHIYAVDFTIQRDDPTPGALVVPNTQPIKYGQDWTAYNQAQIYEGDLFPKLLRELCDTIEQPPQESGRPRLPLSDMVFAAGLKVYSLMSGRRAMSDIRQALTQQQLDHIPGFTTILRCLQKPELTLLLQTLIEKSALPLNAVEVDFAADATGFSTSVYDCWFEHKWGRERKEAKWVKLHVMAGVKTNTIVAAIVTDGNSNDSPSFIPLLTATTNNFKPREVSGDKGYLSKRNLQAVVDAGATPYIPFKVNSTPDQGHHKQDRLWEKAFHYYHLHREEFLAHYHKRSNVETTFSMIKLKFGGSVKAKSSTAQFNEVLVKVLCHNIVVLIQSMFELGAIHAVWSETLNSRN